MFKHLLILTITLTLISGISRADIINIPEDFETIQAGINNSDNGDTVLVQPGEYRENLQFNHSSITLASLTLMSGNPAYADSTIIDGRERASVITINEAQGTNILIGFTIQNGSAENNRGRGGGIYVENCDVTLEDLIIRDNYSGGDGSGIFFEGENTIIIRRVNIENNVSPNRAPLSFYNNQSNAILEDVIIQGNTGRHVGVIFAYGSLNMRNVAILDNEAEDMAVFELFGIGLGNGDEMIWENVTIAGNTGRLTYIYGGIDRGSSLIIRNCLFYGNDDDGINLQNGTLGIEYSLIEGGQDNFQEEREEEGLDWGEGNIEEDPQFVDPDNGDYHLAEDSPCIDAGDPDSDLDPDGTRADIGAFFFLQGSVLEGFVNDFENDMPLEGAEVVTSTGASTVTNDEGFWRIESSRGNEFDLTVSMLGYIDTTMNNLELEVGDTLSLNFNLLHSELQPSIEEITTEIEIGERAQFNFRIGNSGNGVLDWSVKTGYRGDAGLDPWELRQSYQWGEQLEDSRLYGVAYVDSLFYVAGSNDLEPIIYILNHAGELIASFPQPGDHNRGMKDLAWDGELLWGVVDNTVYGMTVAGEVESSFEAPYRSSTAITWDSNRNILWICSTVSNPVGMDRDGNQIDDMEVIRDGLRIYGMAYFPEDSDDAPLYLFCKDIETNLQTLYKHNFEIDEKSFVTYLEPEAGGSPKGAFITDQIDNYSWTFISVADAGNNDRVDVWQLEADVSWSIIDPVEGTINPNAEQELRLTIATEDLLEINYPAQLVFTHNGFGLETIIPIDLTVTPLSIDNRQESLLPLQFAITDIFPNPFNSMVRLNYTVPKASNVSIKLYDITGSLIDIVTNGLHQAGRHSVTWEAATTPSGIYFARMQTRGFSQTVKLMLMK